MDTSDIEKAVEQINLCDTTETICILEKDTFSKVELNDIHKLDLSNLTPRSEFLLALNKQYKDSNTIFIGTTGNTSREMYSFMPDTNNFYMAGNMGGALSLGLGASLAGKNVIVLGGDAEFVMHMGGLTTAGRYQNIDLTYVLFDNEQNKSTGGQNTYQSHVDYINIAKASNLNVVDKIIQSVDILIDTLKQLDHKMINFVYVKCGLDDETPRPPLDVVKVKEFN